MDDNLVLLSSILLTILIGSIGAGILIRLRSFLRNLAELTIAIDNCLDKDCTQEEIRIINTELKESVADGLGLLSAVVGLFSKGGV